MIFLFEYISTRSKVISSIQTVCHKLPVQSPVHAVTRVTLTSPSGVLETLDREFDSRFLWSSWQPMIITENNWNTLLNLHTYLDIQTQTTHTDICQHMLKQCYMCFDVHIYVQAVINIYLNNLPTKVPLHFILEHILWWPCHPLFGKWQPLSTLSFFISKWKHLWHRSKWH